MISPQKFSNVHGIDALVPQGDRPCHRSPVGRNKQKASAKHHIINHKITHATMVVQQQMLPITFSNHRDKEASVSRHKQQFKKIRRINISDAG